MDMDVRWGRKGGIVIAMPVGRVDSSNADLLERMLEAGLDPRDNALILDFEHLSFISSAGLGVGLKFAKKFNESGKKFAACALPECSTTLSRSAASRRSSPFTTPRLWQSRHWRKIS